MVDLLNNNAGVVTAVQTILTICLTVIVARVQYRKKLTIYTGLSCDEHNNCILEMSLYNAGNVPLYIKDIQIQKEYMTGEIAPKCYTYWNEQGKTAEKILVPRTMQDYPLEPFSCTEEEKKKTHMLIVITTEEKTFKKRINWGVG